MALSINILDFKQVTISSKNEWEKEILEQDENKMR